MVIQTHHPLHRKYKGTLHCLASLLSSQSLLSLFTSRIGLLGAVESAVTTTFSQLSKLVAYRWFPYLGFFGPLTIDTLALGVTLPIEVLRRRLEVQSGLKGPLETVVQIPLVPYFGISDCIGRMYREEGTAPDKHSVAPRQGDKESRKRRRLRKRNSRPGIAAFYRGFWSRWMLLAFTHFARSMDLLDIQDDL